MNNETLQMVKGKDGVFTFVMVEEKVETKPEAHMEAGMSGLLDKIPDFHPGGIPVGRAARGMIVAGLGDAAGSMLIRYIPSNLIQGQYSNALLKAATIWLANRKAVKDFLGHDAVETGSIILAYEGIASIVNLRLKTYSLAAGLVGKLPGGIPAAAGTTDTSSSNVVIL